MLHRYRGKQWTIELPCVPMTGVIAYRANQSLSKGGQNMGIGAVDEAIAVIVGAGLLLGGAGAASASTISFGLQSFSVQQSTTPSQTLDFNQFSPSLGTLNEVDILLTGSTIGGGATANLTGGEGGIAKSSFTAMLDVVEPGATNAL